MTLIIIKVFLNTLNFLFKSKLMTTNTLGSLNIPMKIGGLCFLNTFFLLPCQEGNEECGLCLFGECKESKGPGSPCYCASPACRRPWILSSTLKSNRAGAWGGEAYGFYLDSLLVQFQPPSYNLYNPKVGLLTILTLPL